MTSCRFCSFLLILSSTSRPTLSLQSLASASTSKSESRSKAVAATEDAGAGAAPPPPPVAVEEERLTSATEGATEEEVSGREEEPEAVGTVESGRISWEPPGLSTEERMLEEE